MLTHLDPALASKGVVFTDLDAAAATHPDLVERHLHSLVPTDRTKFMALHGAFRTGGTFLYVPRRRADRAAAADADVPGRGRRRRVPAHR